MILKSCVTKLVDWHGDLPQTRPEPVIAAVLHTNGFNGPASLFGAYQARAAAGDHQVAHIQIALDGTAEQYADTKYILGLSWDANDFSVGIENQDVGHTTWTQAQLDKIDEILRELGVPARGLPEDGKGGGVGYHSKFTSWNQSGHVCPGAGRVPQVDGIIARLAGADDDQEDEDMATTDDDYEQRAFTWGQLQRWQGKARPTKSPNLKADKTNENFLDPAQRGWDMANGGTPPALTP